MFALSFSALLRRWPRALLRSRIACAFLLVALTAGLYALALQLYGNFHTVIAGELYRSAQPSAQDIHAYAARYGIKSIINLRGDNTGTPWYDKEIAASKKLGIAHFNFSMSARRELSQPRAESLIALLREAPKPVLVHCTSGSDRSGLASALFLAAIAQKGEFAAEGQLSFRFGHVAIPYFSSSFAMDDSFENLEPWLGFAGS